MKINITINPYELSGYTNISPLEGKDPFNLPCERAECTEIIGENICDYIPHSKFSEIVQGYVSKLRHGGKIILGGTDLFEVSKKCLKQQIEMDDLNKVLYGEQNHTWAFKRSCASLREVAQLLQDLGLKVTKQRLENIYFVVEALRD